MSVLRKILIGVCVALSTLVLIVWQYSYSQGFGYSQASLVPTVDDGAHLSGYYAVIAGGGFVLTHEEFTASDPVVVDFLYDYADCDWHADRGGKFFYRSGRFPYFRNGDAGLLADLGFQSNHRVDLYPGMQRTVSSFSIPFWLIFGLCAGYPIALSLCNVLKHQREERVAMGLCVGCGCSPAKMGMSCLACAGHRAVGNAQLATA